MSDTNTESELAIDIEGLDFQEIQEVGDEHRYGYIRQQIADHLPYYIGTAKLRVSRDSQETHEYHAICLPQSEQLLIQRIELDTEIPNDKPLQDCMLLCSIETMRANSAKADQDATLLGWRFLEVQYNTRMEGTRSEHFQYVGKNS